MKKTLLALVAAALCLAPVVAQAERLNDKDLEKLISKIASDEDKFRDALDPQMKKAIYRGPSGEVNVDRFLKDFSDAAEKLEDRYKKDYSASTEAGDLLRQGTTIDNYFKRDQAATKGESEWNRFADNLKALAAAYGTEFPLPAGAAVRRVSDKEVVAAADGLARDADRLKKAVDSGLKGNKSVDKAAREAAVRDLDGLKREAQALKSAVSGGKPASAQATQLLNHVGKVNEFLGATPVAAATPIMGVLGGKASILSQAFGMASPLPLAR